MQMLECLRYIEQSGLIAVIRGLEPNRLLKTARSPV